MCFFFLVCVCLYICVINLSNICLESAEVIFKSLHGFARDHSLAVYVLLPNVFFCLNFWHTCIGKVDECNVILIGRVYGWWTSIEFRYLLLSFSRRGIGWHLLKASEELISQMSSSREVYLHCRMIDTAPLNMYRKAGYTIVETDNIFILLALQRRKHLMWKVLPDSESLSEVDECTSSVDTWTCKHRQVLRYIIFHGQALFHSLGSICSLLYCVVCTCT